MLKLSKTLAASGVVEKAPVDVKGVYLSRSNASLDHWMFIR